MSEKQTSKDEFMKNYEEQAKDEGGLAPSGEYEERDTLKAVVTPFIRDISLKVTKVRLKATTV